MCGCIDKLCNVVCLHNALWIDATALPAFAPESAGVNSGDFDVVWLHLVAKIFAETGECILADAVRGSGWISLQRSDGADVEDVPAFLLHHGGKERAGEMISTVEVGLHHHFEDVFFFGGDGAGEEGAGVVDEDINGVCVL